MKLKTIQKGLIISSLLYCIGKVQLSYTIDCPQWYKAPLWSGEPRFEKKKLFSLNAIIRGAQNKTGFNACKNKVNALEIYGPEELQYLTKNVSNEIRNINPTNIINTILQAPSNNSHFGRASIRGTFSVIDAQLNAQYNFSHTFFSEVSIPFCLIRVHNISIVDHSNSINAGKTIDLAAWHSFVGNLTQNIRTYGIELGAKTTTGIGDILLLTGATKNYQDTVYVDFVDTTLKAGILLPTGHSPDQKFVFDFPLGYNRHPGLLVSAQTSVGLYEWLTIGGHTQFIWFIDRTHCLRMKTAYEQNGFIKLSQGMAKTHEGSLWGISSYLKSDHLTNGISCLIGFSHYRKRANCIMPCDREAFNMAIVNTDTLTRGWSMSTIHALFEYDMATEEKPDGLRIQLLVDAIVRGKRILKSNTLGCSIGVDYVW